MKKIIVSILVCLFLLGAPVVHAATQPTYDDLVAQLVSLLKQEIAQLQGELQAMIDQQNAVASSDTPVTGPNISIQLTTPDTSVSGSTPVTASNPPIEESLTTTTPSNAPVIVEPSCTLTVNSYQNPLDPTGTLDNVTWSTQGINSSGMLYAAQRWVGGLPDFTYGDGNVISASGGTLTVGHTYDYKADFSGVICTAHLK